MLYLEGDPVRHLEERNAVTYFDYIVEFAYIASCDKGVRRSSTSMNNPIIDRSINIARSFTVGEGEKYHGETVNYLHYKFESSRIDSDGIEITAGAAKHRDFKKEDWVLKR